MKDTNNFVFRPEEDEVHPSHRFALIIALAFGLLTEIVLAGLMALVIYLFKL